MHAHPGGQGWVLSLAAGPRESKACFRSLAGYGVGGVPNIALAGAGPSCSHGSIWPALKEHGFLPSGVCPLVGEAGLETCVGFLVEGLECVY